jgi:hypothetical protein
VNHPPNNKKAGVGLQPGAGSENQLRAGLAHNAIASMTDATDNPQLTLDFGAPVPDGSYAGADLANENAEDHWRDWALREIGILASNGHEFTADEVRQVVGEPDVANRWGGVFLAARRAGLIEPTGSVRPSTTATRHGSLVRVWRAA